MSTVSTRTMYWVGLDVHKDSVTAAVFRNRDAEPMRVDRLRYDHKQIRRYFERLGKTGTARACYEASGAGYVLQRAMTEWGMDPPHPHAGQARRRGPPRAERVSGPSRVQAATS